MPCEKATRPRLETARQRHGYPVAFRCVALAVCLLAVMACTHDARRSAPTAPLAQKPESTLAQELGDDTVQIVTRAERVMFAKLELVSADEAQQPNALSDPARVGGYPLQGNLVGLEPTAARGLTHTLLARPNYALKLRWRCIPEQVVGFRFVTREAWV